MPSKKIRAKTKKKVPSRQGKQEELIQELNKEIQLPTPFETREIKEINEVIRKSSHLLNKMFYRLLYIAYIKGYTITYLLILLQNSQLQYNFEGDGNFIGFEDGFGMNLSKGMKKKNKNKKKCLRK
jgi:hypothetical protein